MLPNWTGVFQVLKGTPHSRKGTVLQGICDYLISILTILAALRFEASLHQCATQVFIQIFSNSFTFETLDFQHLRQDLNQLPNSCEIEIATKFLKNKCHFYLLRIEYSILTMPEKTFITQGDKNKIYIFSSNADFFETIEEFWCCIHYPMYEGEVKSFSERYMPGFLLHAFANTFSL